MSLVYILQEDGQHVTLEESEVRDLLARQVLASETQFWKEGMDEWRPLSELAPQRGPAFVPARRNPDSVSSSENPVKSFQAMIPQVQPETPAMPKGEVSSPKRKGARYRLRYNLLPLTISMQVLYIVVICVRLFLMYQCLDKIYGWSASSGAAVPDPTAVLMGANSSMGGTTGVSPEEMHYFYYFSLALIGVHLVMEAMFLIWVYYANKNCRGMANNMIYTAGWAVGYFFIPLVNLFRPCQVVQELWKVSQNPRGWIGRRDSIFVFLWFSIRIAAWILAKGPFHTSYSDSDDPRISALGTVIYLTTVEGVMTCIDLTTLILVSVITWRQIRWYRQVSASNLPAEA
jgi:hypothetical protein